MKKDSRNMDKVDYARASPFDFSKIRKDRL